MNKSVKTKELFDCETIYLKKLFDKYMYPWELVNNLKDYMNNLIKMGLDGFNEIEDGIFVGENVKISNNVSIESPAIIGNNTELRTGAFLRGYVIVGDNCVIGNSTELKNCILLNNVQVPHYNYVGDSVLGNYAHMGAGAICSNLKSDHKNIVIKGDNNYETNMRKLGAILGDFADIGCGCVLNPGTIIGKRTSVYPLTSVRGVVSGNCIVKSMSEIVEKT